MSGPRQSRPDAFQEPASEGARDDDWDASTSVMHDADRLVEAAFGALEDEATQTSNSTEHNSRADPDAADAPKLRPKRQQTLLGMGTAGVRVSRPSPGAPGTHVFVAEGSLLAGPEPPAAPAEGPPANPPPASPRAVQEPSIVPGGGSAIASGPSSRLAASEEVEPPRAKKSALGPWALLVILVPLAGGAGAAASWLLLSARRPPAPAVATSALQREAAPEQPSAAPVPVAPVAAPPTVTERAAAGDAAAMDELSSHPRTARTVGEVLALAQGRAAAKRRELGGLEHPELPGQREHLSRLKELFLDGDTALPALAFAAELPGSIGPDLLYQTWVGTPHKTEMTLVAEELLFSKEVYEKAPPALRVALDLRAAEKCEEFLEILPRARQSGDRRSTAPLVKLLRKRGCGPKKLDDCYACLRALGKSKPAVSVADALTAARRRPAPTL